MSGKILRIRSTTTRPGDATAYAAGDEIANSATAGSVVRMTYDMSGYSRGRILSASMDITPASSNLVITALNLQAAIFKTQDAPAAVGDNVALSIPGATRNLAIAHLLFDDGGWMNPAGAFAAGASGFQEVPATVYIPLATPVVVQHVPGCWFTFDGDKLAQRELTAVLQVLAAWTPLGVINTIGLTLDIEAY